MTNLKRNNQLFNLKAGVYALTLAGFLLSTTAASYAASNTKATKDIVVSEKADQEVEKGAQDKTTEKRKEIISEAVSALQETHKALKALDENKSKDALTALEKATGKLEIILARDPALALAPTNVSAVTYDIVGSLETIKQATKKAKDFLDDGKIQDARHLMKGLAREFVIRQTNLPLATYPAALKSAAALIDDGKVEEAKKVLQSALNTLIITETILPLPIITADHLLDKAQKLIEKNERTGEQNKHIESLLNEAQTEIKFAQALGYGTQKEIEEFHEELDQIRKKSSEGKSGLGFFTKIKKSVTSMFDSSQAPKEETHKN